MADNDKFEGFLDNAYIFSEVLSSTDVLDVATSYFTPLQWCSMVVGFSFRYLSVPSGPKIKGCDVKDLRGSKFLFPWVGQLPWFEFLPADAPYNEGEVVFNPATKGIWTHPLETGALTEYSGMLAPPGCMQELTEPYYKPVAECAQPPSIQSPGSGNPSPTPLPPSSGSTPAPSPNADQMMGSADMDSSGLSDLAWYLIYAGIGLICLVFMN